MYNLSTKRSLDRGGKKKVLMTLLARRDLPGVSVQSGPAEVMTYLRLHRAWSPALESTCEQLTQTHRKHRRNVWQKANISCSVIVQSYCRDQSACAEQWKQELLVDYFIPAKRQWRCPSLRPCPIQAAECQASFFDTAFGIGELPMLVVPSPS